MRWMPVLAMLCACGDPSLKPDAGGDAPISDAAAAPDSNPKNPPTLMDTGLCVDAACTQIAPGIKAYTPRFQLWSDGATKKRWIYLPPGSKIDTTDMDFWQFPVGTKVWKEFTRDNVRVETRLVMRIADTPGNPDEDWFYMAYVWNQTQDATTAEPFGVTDANGTPHDVPSRVQCRTCHNNTQPSRVLGFSAIQLDWDNPDPDELDLPALIANDALTTQPSGSATPHFPLPGTDTDKAALGYMHANCGHCHNPHSKVYSDIGVTMQLRLTVGTLGSVATTPVYTTAVNQNSTITVPNLTKIITPGDPDNSIMIFRFEGTTTSQHMPPIGTEVMDTTGDTTLRNWVTNLQ